MKQLIGTNIGTYEFDPFNRKITIHGINTLIRLEQLLLITNVVDNVLIYNFVDPSLGATITNNIITLDYDTTSMSSTDNLQIFIDIYDNNDDLLSLIKRQNKMLESLMTVDSSNRQRVAVESMPSTVVTGTVTATNTTGIGVSTTVATPGNPYAVSAQNVQVVAPVVDYREQLKDSARNTYANGIRSKLFFN